MVRQGRRGLSLLETAFASFLFATISVALISLWYSHYKLLAQSQHRLVAQYLCKQLMEDQLNQSYASIMPVARGSQPPITINSVINGNERSGIFEYAVVVVNTPYTKDVTMQVFWKEGELQHEYHLETLLFTLY